MKREKEANIVNDWAASSLVGDKISALVVAEELWHFSCKIFLLAYGLVLVLYLEK